MSSALLQSVISALVPILLAEAEQLLDVAPNPNDTSWVVGLINQICALFEKLLPAWIVPSEQQVKALVEAEIEKILKI